MKKIAVTLMSIIASASPALADPQGPAGDWMVRARMLGVIPQESSHMNIADKVRVDNSVVPELDITYFFSDNIAAELIAAVTPHDISTRGGVDAGSAWLLPPTATLQYHFTDYDQAKPYLGAGVNYTHFFNAKAGSLNAVKYDDSIGFALQAGIDVPIADRWYFNADVKKIWIDTTARFSPSGVRADVDINPLLVGVGIGYRF